MNLTVFPARNLRKTEALKLPAAAVFLHNNTETGDASRLRDKFRCQRTTIRNKTQRIKTVTRAQGMTEHRVKVNDVKTPVLLLTQKGQCIRGMRLNLTNSRFNARVFRRKMPHAGVNNGFRERI